MTRFAELIVLGSIATQKEAFQDVLDNENSLVGGFSLEPVVRSTEQLAVHWSEAAAVGDGRGLRSREVVA